MQHCLEVGSLHETFQVRLLFMFSHNIFHLSYLASPGALEHLMSAVQDKRKVQLSALLLVHDLLSEDLPAFQLKATATLINQKRGIAFMGDMLELCVDPGKPYPSACHCTQAQSVQPSISFLLHTGCFLSCFTYASCLCIAGDSEHTLCWVKDTTKSSQEDQATCARFCLCHPRS